MTVLADKKLDAPEALARLRDEIIARKQRTDRSVRVCIGTGCAAKGSRRVLDLFAKAVEESGKEIEITAETCGNGMCRY